MCVCATAPAPRHGAFDPALMRRLRAIVDGCGGASICLSSSWRQSEWGRDEVDEQLAAHGMGGARIGCTPADGYLSRADEILAWLVDQPSVTQCVALDDLDLAAELLADGSDTSGAPEAPAPMIAAHFVQTDTDVGLTDADVARALEALKLRIDRAAMPAPRKREPLRF